MHLVRPPTGAHGTNRAKLFIQTTKKKTRLCRGVLKAPTEVRRFLLEQKFIARWHVTVVFRDYRSAY